MRAIKDALARKGRIVGEEIENHTERVCVLYNDEEKERGQVRRDRLVGNDKE